MILASLTLLAYTVVLSTMRVPYAFIVGPLARLAEFVPVVGPAIAAIAVLLIAFFAGYKHILILLLFRTTSMRPGAWGKRWRSIRWPKSSVSLLVVRSLA
jgi:predicted PurR-regulated permease PerM